MSEKKFDTERLRMWRTVEHNENFKATLRNIEQHGWSALTITGEPDARFAYTVGAYDTQGVPEVVVVGLSERTSNFALNLAVERMQDGVDLTKGRHRDIVGEVEVEFRPVAKRWIEHVMYRAHWYYGGDDFPVLQLIYPDLEGRFQDEECFTEYFRQPMLGEAEADGPREKDFWAQNDPGSSLFDWKFPDPPHTRIFLSQTVQDREEPITYVSHDHDGDWQMLGDRMADGGGPVISCFHHPIDWDPSLIELHDLPVGFYAAREAPESAWERFALPPDAEENQS